MGKAKSSLKEEKMVSRIFLTLLLASPALSLFFGPPSKNCRSDRDCPGFRRTTCEGRGPNFLFIFPTCGRERPYTVPGKSRLPGGTDVSIRSLPEAAKENQNWLKGNPKKSQNSQEITRNHIQNWLKGNPKMCFFNKSLRIFCHFYQ